MVRWTSDRAASPRGRRQPSFSLAATTPFCSIFFSMPLLPTRLRSRHTIAVANHSQVDRAPRPAQRNGGPAHPRARSVASLHGDPAILPPAALAARSISVLVTASPLGCRPLIRGPAMGVLSAVSVSEIKARGSIKDVDVLKLRRSYYDDGHITAEE